MARGGAIAAKFKCDTKLRNIAARRTNIDSEPFGHGCTFSSLEF